MDPQFTDHETGGARRDGRTVRHYQGEPLTGCESDRQPQMLISGEGSSKLVVRQPGCPVTIEGAKAHRAFEEPIHETKFVDARHSCRHVGVLKAISPRPFQCGRVYSVRADADANAFRCRSWQTVEHASAGPGKRRPFGKPETRKLFGLA